MVISEYSTEHLRVGWASVCIFVHSCDMSNKVRPLDLPQLGGCIAMDKIVTRASHLFQYQVVAMLIVDITNQVKQAI